MPKAILLIFIYCLAAACTSSSMSTKTPLSNTKEESIVTDSLVKNSQLLYRIDITSKGFATDKLGQLYLISPKNEVIKYDTKGKEVFRYNNNFLENLEQIDATDPFNLLLYYPDYLTVITLDRTMSKTGEFDLSDLNLLRVKTVATSNDNQVWIYDELSFQLKKINRSGEVLRQSVDLNLQLNHPPRADYLVEKENGVYLNDPNFGILIFNMFGEYESMIALKGLDRFQVFDNRLIYKKGKQIYTYHLQTLSEQVLPIPETLEVSDEILIQKNRLFIRKENSVEVYSFGA